MADFLKAHPFMSMDDYLWNVNPCLTKLMAIDNTRIHYLSDKDKKRKKTQRIDGRNLTNDLGIPIFGDIKK